MIELSEAETCGLDAFECIKRVVAANLREGYAGPIVVEVSRNSWESAAVRLEASGRFLRFSHARDGRVSILTSAWGREVAIVASDEFADRTFRMLQTESPAEQRSQPDRSGFSGNPVKTRES